MSKYIKKTIQQIEMDSFRHAHEEVLLVDQIKRYTILVTNFTKATKYIVKKDKNYIYDCDCCHHTFRNVICKHMVIASEETNTPLL